MTLYLPNDDHTNVRIVTPSSYGWAQADPQKVSRKKKHPLGFSPPPEKTSAKRSPKSKAK